MTGQQDGRTERDEQEPEVGEAIPTIPRVPVRAPGGPGGAGRHRQHVFPARGHALKVLYAEGERASVALAAELTGLRPSSFVAAAALLMARGLVQSIQPPTDGEGAPMVGEMLAGRPVVVAWSAGQDQELLAELVAARLALRRYGVNVNQAVAALNSGAQAPVWLEQAVAGSDRAVARVDAAAAALTRRLI